ncbi:MAG: AAA family ATPase, partial [Caldilineaceae bacterium]|nr:AAA family ATPase [Caldilineaceae bacterium]
MSDELAKRLANLKLARDAGALNEDTFQAAVAALTAAGLAADAAHPRTVSSGDSSVAVGGDIKGNVYVGKPPADAAEAVRIYCRVFVKTHRQLPLRGIDVQAANPQHGDERLDLDRVYISLNTRSTILEEIEDAPTRRRARDADPGEEDDSGLVIAGADVQKRTLTALEATGRDLLTALLGDPGSGKSTFVNFLCYVLAGAMLEAEAAWQAILEHRFDAPL